MSDPKVYGTLRWTDEEQFRDLLARAWIYTPEKIGVLSPPCCVLSSCQRGPSLTVHPTQQRPWCFLGLSESPPGTSTALIYQRSISKRPLRAISATRVRSVSSGGAVARSAAFYNGP